MTRNFILRAVAATAMLIAATLAGIVNAAPASAEAPVLSMTVIWSTYGQPTIIAGTVKDPDGPGGSCPAGEVRLYDGDNPQPFVTAPVVADDPCELGSGSWQFSGGSVLSAGSHQVRVDYIPGNFDPTSATFTVGINRSPTSINLVRTFPHPAVVGQAVTLQARVWNETPNPRSSDAAPPTGEVEFFDGSESLGTAPLVHTEEQGDVVSKSVTLTSARTHTLSARYLGDTNYDWSFATPQDFTVNKGDTTMQLALPPSPSVYGQELWFGGAAVPTPPARSNPPVMTGDITFEKIGQGVVAGTNNYNMSVQYPSTMPLAVGSHSFRFTWSGDSNFNGATASFSHTVNKADTTTTMAPTSPNPSSLGDEVTLAASVTAAAPGAGTPTGAVQFLDGTMPLGAPVALTGATATLKLTSLGGGAHSITARYLGDGNFNPSASAPVSHTVRCDTTVSNVNGNYSVPTSGSTCIVGGTVTGNVTVPAGAALSITNSTIGGSVVSWGGARLVLICGTTLSDLTINGATGPVVVGSPVADGCTGNVLRSSARIQSNRGGVRVGGNRIAGWLQCSGNTPVANNGGAPNTKTGGTGECAAPTF